MRDAEEYEERENQGSKDDKRGREREVPVARFFQRNKKRKHSIFCSLSFAVKLPFSLLPFFPFSSKTRHTSWEGLPLNRGLFSLTLCSYFVYASSCLLRVPHRRKFFPYSCLSLFLPWRDKEVNWETSQMFPSYLCSQLLHSKVPSSCSHRLRHKKSYLLLAKVQQEQHILSHLSSPWLFVCFMMIRKPNEFLSLAKTTGMTGSPSSSNELPSRRRKRRKTKKGTRRRWGLKKVTLGRRVEGPQWLQSLATFSPVSLSLHGLSFLEKRVITCDGEKCVSWRKSRARVWQSLPLFIFHDLDSDTFTKQIRPSIQEKRSFFLRTS